MNDSATTHYLSFDSEQLGRLITNLYTLTDIRVNALDTKGNKLYVHNNPKPFCELMNSDPEGHRRCLECDRLALEKCMAGETDAYDYRCHAGICEHILPIQYNGKPFAFLIFGQMLDESPLEEQWKNTEALLSWYSGDINALRKSFGEFRRVILPKRRIMYLLTDVRTHFMRAFFYTFLRHFVCFCIDKLCIYVYKPKFLTNY